MGVFGRKQLGGGRPAYGGGGGHVRRSWVIAAQEGFIRVVSFLFSAYSADAIGRVFAPPGSSLSQLILGYGLATCFAGTGFFVSRAIAYRLMIGQGIWAYLPVCFVVELAEIYCNYVVGVHDLNLGILLQGLPADQHPFLTVVGCVVASSIPAMVLFLAVLEMDFEKRKVAGGSAQPKAVPIAAYASQASPTFNNAATQPVQKIQRSVRPVPQQVQGGASTNGANPPLQGVTAP